MFNKKIKCFTNIILQNFKFLNSIIVSERSNENNIWNTFFNFFPNIIQTLQATSWILIAKSHSHRNNLKVKKLDNYENIIQLIKVLQIK